MFHGLARRPVGGRDRLERICTNVANGRIVADWIWEFSRPRNGVTLAEETFHIPRDYMLNHMVCDFTESVRWWMKHEQYSPEEIAEFYLSTTPELR